MAEPTITVEVAFGYSPIDPDAVWVDITDYVEGLETKRGRNTELDTIDAGTTTLTLDNSDGLFTPHVAEAGRPWEVTPRVPTRVTATFNGTTYPIAFGIIERWPYALDNSDTAQVQIVDISKWLGDITFANSDTAMIARQKPIDYFPMQETEAPLFSTTTQKALNPAWDGAQYPPIVSEDNPLPVITYGAESNLPSDSGNSVDLGGFWAQTD